MYELRKDATFFLLRSYGVNYPIIREQHYDLPKAILFVTGEEEGKATVGFLESDLDVRIDEQMKASQLAALMGEVNSGFIIYYAVCTRKSMEFVEILGAAARSGRFSGAEVTAPILVVVEGIPTGVDLHNFFLIFHESVVREETLIQFDDVVPAEESLPIVFDKMKEYCCENVDFRAWIAAACFMYPQLKTEERNMLFRHLLISARLLVAADENNQGEESLGENVVDAFYQWQKETGFCNLIELPNIGRAARLNLRKYIFYDDQYIFLSNSLFNEITESLQRTYSSIRLKFAIQNEGILYPDHEETYTAKMRYYNEDFDRFERKRMIRLRRDKLIRLGGIGFVELCLEVSEEDVDD